MSLMTPDECARHDRALQDAYWGDQAAAVSARTVIALNEHGERAFYVFDPGEPMSSQPHTSRGFNGVHWRITWLDGRPEVETNNLWNGAVIPARFLDQFPVNAVLEYLGTWGRPARPGEVRP